jgi:hypothetical protein
MGNDIPHKYPFSFEGPLRYAMAVKLVHIQRNQIFTDEKYLKHYHVQDMEGKRYGMQLFTIGLGQ